MPRADDLEALLGTLCVKLGFCLTGEKYDRLIESPPLDPVAYADAVIESDGMDPRKLQSDIYAKVLAEVTQTFEAASCRTDCR